MNSKQQLKALADARRGVLVPGAFNALSARVVADLGFEAIYITGAGVTNMWFGLPDQAFMGLTDMADHTARMRDAVDLPLIVDWPNRPRQMVDHTIGKPATTHFTVLERDALTQRTRVGLTPITGRSHQLRVHLASLGHSIIGDSLYAEAPPALGGRLMLHAAQLAFPHPVTGELREFSSAVPF